jgi:hypothetical protein
MSETNGATTIASRKGGPMGSGTVAGLMAFFDYLTNKGMATPAAITPLKSAARQVFETVEGTENIDEIDVRSLDVDEYLDRFQVKAMSSGRYKPESITAYRSRFGRGIDYYTTFLTTGTPPKIRLRASSGPASKRAASSDDAPRSATGSAGTTEAPDMQSPTGNLISYPFPLQSGGIANLRLPVRLERADAERMATFIRTLVFEPQKELSQGQSDPDDSSS